VKLNGRHLLGLNDLSRQEADEILELCGSIKTDFKAGKTRETLAGKSVAMIFEKSSTRTRVSFHVGIEQLGGRPLFLAGHEMQLSRGEPIKDTARVLSRYVDAVVIRANRHEDVVEFAEWSSVPVINGLTDLFHPCQILADLFTMKEKGFDLDDFVAVFVGDGNNVANSWINAAALYGFEMRVACPEGYDPDLRVMTEAKEKGAKVSIVRDPKEAADGANLLYTDVWVSMRRPPLHRRVGQYGPGRGEEAQAPRLSGIHDRRGIDREGLQEGRYNALSAGTPR